MTAHSYSTPVMGLLLPVPGVTDRLGVEAPGASWMELQNTAFGLLDSHNHSPGYGNPVPTSGININADLTFGGYNALALRAVKFTSQGSLLSAPADIGCIYFYQGDAYINDAAGNQIRVTSAGALAGTPGSISGLVSPASATYTPISALFSFFSASTKYANVALGPLSIFDTAVGITNAVQLKSPVGLASAYALTFPAALPGSTLPLLLSSAGVMSAAQLTASQLSSSAGILGTQLSSSANILGSQLSNNTLTNTQQNFGTPAATTDVVIKSYADALIKLTNDTGAIVWGTNWSDTGRTRLMRQAANGMVSLNLSATATGAPGSPILTLPVGDRPYSIVVVPMWDANASAVVSCIIGTDGTITSNSTTNGHSYYTCVSFSSL